LLAKLGEGQAREYLATSNYANADPSVESGAIGIDGALRYLGL